MHCLFALAALFALSPIVAQEPENQSEAAPPQPVAPREQPAEQKPQDAPVANFTQAMVNDLVWRNLGPANPMGRVTDIEIAQQAQSTWYVGTAGGGVFKTSNAGTTWQNVFDKYGSVSIGDVTVAPSNPAIVWVGTGEANPRNSVQWGDGVYKSTDSGASFVHMGLRESFQIGHIAIHPTNADIVYVAALGKLWGDNQERGVFRTKDGGTNWEKVLFLDAQTGCVDVRIDPQEPNTVFACMYQRQRSIFDDNDPSVRFGKSAGLFKSTDNGANWRQLKNGLPTCQWGRSGIDISAQNPATLFLIVESERSGWATGTTQRTADKQPESGNNPPANESETPAEQPAEKKPGTPATPVSPEATNQGNPAALVPPGGRGAGQRGGLSPRGSAILGIGGEGQGKDGDATAPGAIIVQLTEGGPAATKGLKVGDRIIKIDIEDVKTYADLSEILADSRGGQTAKIRYVRGQETLEVELTYGSRDVTSGMGNFASADFPNGGRLFGQTENRQARQGAAGYETGGVFKSDDHGETWTRVNSLTERPFYYSVIRIDPQNDKNVYCVGTTLWGTSNGGEKFALINRSIHVDFHAVWIDPNDSDHLLAGCDGGVNETFDRGKSWQVITGFCAAQFYDIVADNSVPYNVIGGLQDNGEWIGPSRTRNREGITTKDWRTLWSGDGFGAAVDPLEPWILFLTSQNGGLGMLDLRTGNQVSITRERPKEGRADFNWDAPFALSPHNRLMLWSAGQFVYRSDRYAHLDNRQNRDDQGPLKNQSGMSAQIVSPRLPLTEKGTATAIAESPLSRGLLYVGTDDGALWRGDLETHDWQQIQQNLPLAHGPRYISDIVPSHHKAGRVYLTLDGHRFDDFHTYAFVSEDRGATWRSLAESLPLQEPCYAIMEDPRAENLLFLGTEYGCYVSLDRGDTWLPMGRELPTVAVRDLFIQDRDADLIAATHGRGAWVCDLLPLREFTGAIALQDSHLFRPDNAILWRMTSLGFSGNREYRAANPPYGTTIYAYLKNLPEKPPSVTIHDVTGKQVASLTLKAQKGLQAVQWDARIGNKLAGKGSYSARMTYGEKTSKQVFALYEDPQTSAPNDDATSPTGGQK
ncbi:hypothetical protein LBMAG49_29080 [Planctomycetota bacterium]|nr:hypothetical protein LBMAG49_29080 [Planctomycetota bacterium]